MFIRRDITARLAQATNWIQVLIGPRQCGKSTLFTSLYLGEHSSNKTALQEVNFDDLQLRQLANTDPALFLQQFEPPLLLDEIQYVPNLFPELKKRIDQLKRENLFGKNKIEPSVLFRLTGSNQILIDKNVKESLAGRASFYYLNTLTVHEILNAAPETKIKNILFNGGWPELYTNPTLKIVDYLNDYIRSYVEKDIVISAGIAKISAFHTVLGLLGSRTGQLIDYTNIAQASGISSMTVKEWISLLERADLIYLLKPYSDNLNKRLIKSPKLYFMDTGLATRLQGWSELIPLFNSPQIGGLFETLVATEIIKFIRNYGKDWQLYYWRTKEGEEIDFILKTADGKIFGFDAKLAIQGVTSPKRYPPAFLKHMSTTTPLILVTYGGQRLELSSQCSTLPLADLHDYLKTL